MARKKKKTRTRKQLRRQTKTRQRRAKRRTSHPVRSSRVDDELLDDMLPLLPAIQEASADPGPSMRHLMMILLASEEWVEEPEFEAVFIDPMLAVDTYITTGENLGIDPDSLGALPEEEREDLIVSMLEATIARLLNADLRQQIIDALNTLRLRLKRSGQVNDVAKVAALQSFLSSNENSEIWPLIGLVQAIVQRSVVAGFELYQVSLEALEDSGLEDSETTESLRDRVAGSAAVQRVSALVNKVPGLSGFLENQADKVWEEGVEAVYSGELYLNLFTQEELSAVVDIFHDIVADYGPQPAGPLASSPRLSDEAANAFIERIDAYIAQLFTPERLAQLRERLTEIERDPTYRGKWSAFLLLLSGDFEEAELQDYEKSFLVSALLGEIKATALESAEHEDMG